MAIGLEAVDYVNAYIYCHDGTYFYGVKSGLAGTKLCRGTNYDNLAEIFDFGTVSAGLSPTLAWAPAPGVVIACCVSASTYKGYLYRSEDSGATWDMVLRIGDTDGTDEGHIAYSNAIPRSLCVDEYREKLYFGEYNYNWSRTAGGINDRVALWESSDDGETWSVVATWNTDGSTNQFRHIHGVLKDPYTHDIYIVTGEDDAGVIRWDGVSEVASNTHPTGYTDWSTGVFGAGNSGKWRLCDILFDAEWMYGFADTLQTGNRGIFRIAKDLSSIVAVNTEIASFDKHVGYLGVKSGSGVMHFLGYLESGGTDKQINVFSGSGGVFHLSGKYGVTVAPTSPRQFMRVGGDILISCSGAGKAGCATAVVREVPLSDAKVLHPVYWVAKGGTDSTTYPRGHRPSSPWGSVKYALTDDRVTFGARVVVGAGRFEEATIFPSWDANARPGTGRVLVQGAGAGSTQIVLPSGFTGSYLFYLDGTELASRFERVALDTDSVTTSSVFRVVGGHDAELIECVCCGAEKSFSSFFANSGSKLKVERCFLAGDSNSGAFTISGTSPLITIHSSIFSGLNGIAYISSAISGLLILNSVLHGFSNKGLTFTSAASFGTLRIKNNVISAASGRPAIVSNVAINITDEMIDYNYYSGSLIGVTNSGGPNKITIDPKFYDAAAQDFRLKTDSPLRGAGAAVDVATDFVGEAFGAQPSIGAYEYSDIRWGQKSNFDATMPALSLAPTAPGSLLEVQEWSKSNVTKKQIDGVR